MPEYGCQSCGAVWYGWGSKGICQKCGGRLELVIEEEESNESEETDKK